jgi:AraC-like DNA-binding protein
MGQKDNMTAENEKTWAKLNSTLPEKIARWTKNERRLITSIPTLTLHRWDTPTEPTSYMLAPSICLIGQGAKRVLLGEEIYTYDANHFLITSVDLPLVAQIIEASSTKPYLGLTLKLDLQLAAQLIINRNLPIPQILKAQRGIAVNKLSQPLIDAFQRLIDLLETPKDIPILSPLIQQEILYRLLTSEQGPRLRQIVSAGNNSYQIAQAIEWLKDNFNQPFRVDELASDIGMSSSAFYNHFRSLTAMSPLQFQKRLRLNEARRLMLMERFDATTAAFEVGYESPSQFSREYRRFFGEPPLHDIKNLQQVSVD